MKIRNKNNHRTKTEGERAKILVNFIVIFLICLFLFGCTVEGELADDSESELVTCTDTRDGEVFKYHTKDVTDIRVGLLNVPSTFNIIDTDGIKRNMSTAHGEWLKCVSR